MGHIQISPLFPKCPLESCAFPLRLMCWGLSCSFISRKRELGS